MTFVCQAKEDLCIIIYTKDLSGEQKVAQVLFMQNT
jgi:hypothetical protein